MSRPYGVSAFLRRVRRRLAGEGGFVLPIVIGVSTVLGIAGTTTMVYSTENQGSAAHSRADLRAQALAEAGLNNAYATLYGASDPTQPGAVPLRIATYEDGTATYSGTLDTQTNVWTLVGIGRVPNPQGPVDVIRTARGRVHIATGQAGTANNAIWNYVYAEAPTTCTTLPNSVNVNVPLYVKGSLCLNNSAQVSGANTVLQVGGTLTFNNSSHVGDPGAPIAEAHVAGGCRIGNGALHSPCTAADRVNSTIPANATVTGLEKPTVDFAGWYQNSEPGPKHACTSGSFPGGFDNDQTMNNSLTPAVDLTPNGPYDCQVRDVQGNLLGRIAWTPGSSQTPGTLTVAGTIFFDGDISFRNLTNAVYQGRATIYASGTITLRNSTTLCGVVGCNSSWQPTQNLLAFVAGGEVQGVSFSAENAATFQGAIYADEDYSEANGAKIWGPIIARQIFLQNSTENHYVPLGTLLPGMPADYQEVVTLSNEPGSWG